MTPQELARLHKENNPNSHFFDKATLLFFGERYEDMWVEEVSVCNNEGQRIPAYKLTSLQRNAPVRNFYSRHYFDRTTFEEITDFKFEIA